MNIIKIAKDIDYLEKNIECLSNKDLVYTPFHLQIQDNDVKNIVLQALKSLLKQKRFELKEYIDDYCKED